MFYVLSYKTRHLLEYIMHLYCHLQYTIHYSKGQETNNYSKDACYSKVQ